MKRILIVEDQEDHRELIIAILEDDYTLSTAIDGEQVPSGPLANCIGDDYAGTLSGNSHFVLQSHICPHWAGANP